MAIEFDCPYCTSTIRVGDAAAGKRGRCPRCTEQLIVPNVAAPPQAAPTMESQPAPVTPAPQVPIQQAPFDPAAASAAQMVPPTTQAQPPGVAPVVHDPGTINFTPPTQPSVSAARLGSQPRRSRRSNKLAWGILAVCAMAVLGSLIGFMWKNQPLVLEGTFDGQTVTTESITASIVPDPTGVDADQQTKVLQSLQKFPLPLRSSLIVTELRSTGTNLEVRYLPTGTAQIIRVSLQDEEALKQWWSENEDRVLSVRNKDLKAATRKFFTAYKASAQSTGSIADSAYFRNRLALATMNPGIGYILQGQVALPDEPRPRACPCIHEDDVGSMYFAVPLRATSFTIVGRKLDSGKKMFPGTYTINIDAMQEQIEAGSSGEPNEPESTEEAGSESNSNDAKADDDSGDAAPAGKMSSNEEAGGGFMKGKSMKSGSVNGEMSDMKSDSKMMQ